MRVPQVLLRLQGEGHGRRRAEGAQENDAMTQENDAMTVTNDLSRTTALVMGQMAGQMFSGMLKTLLDAKSSKS